LRKAYSTSGHVEYAVLAGQFDHNQCNESLPAAATELEPCECWASIEPLPATLWPPALSVWLVLPMRPAEGLGCVGAAGLGFPMSGDGLDGVAAAAAAGADLVVLVIAAALAAASLVAVASAPALTALVERSCDFAALSALLSTSLAAFATGFEFTGLTDSSN
jgi:hypothetical protein